MRITRQKPATHRTGSRDRFRVDRADSTVLTAASDPCHPIGIIPARVLEGRDRNGDSHTTEMSPTTENRG